MLSIWTVGLIVVIYLALLFSLAFWGDSRLRDNQQHPILYSLGLGVHCTSWAFFGTTTQATQYGWAFIPTYVGIAIVMIFAFPVILRISRLCQQHNISSLADFIGLRYRHSHPLAALITIISFIGVIPYIALQLDAITESINLITPAAQNSGNTVGLYVAALMALFSILFGTRTLSLTEKHPGLLLSIAFESLIKLIALSVVGLYVCYSLFDGPFDLFAQAALNPKGQEILYANSGFGVYFSHILLGVCSMFVLPRQFHMNFIELNGESELRTARWLFPTYLLAMTLFVLPIALAGNLLLDTNKIESDTFVLALPLMADNMSISITAFIGGLSATTSMVIVATLALGIMIANNLITPLWLKIHLKQTPSNSMQASRILTIRRVTVLVVLSVAYWYHINVSQAAPLVKSGIIAIALLSQTLPPLLFGLYWQASTQAAAMSGMLAGFLGWLVWLLYPSIMSSYYFNQAPSDAELGTGYIASLLINCVVFLLVCGLFPNRIKRDQHTHANSQELDLMPDLAIRIGDLTTLTKRVLEPAVHQALLNQLSIKVADKKNQGFASQGLLLRVEKLLAAQVGNPSARILLSAIADAKQDGLSELVDWVEEASQTFQFNHEVLQSSVQHIEQGISVLDQNLCMLAWNERYLELFNYPRGFIQVGMSIEYLLKYNAERGLLGNSNDIDNEISKRIQYMSTGSRYKYVRKHHDDRVIELNGSPLPGGGFVTTYSDITEYIHIQEQLESAKTELEQRVILRTEQLEQAKLEADKANESKTKFLAAAGHDLMQPFNAATLFASMLAQKTTGSELKHISDGLVNSLDSAEQLLSTLLDMTKLESGVLTAQISEFNLDDLLQPLVHEFAVICQQKNLQLHYVPTRLGVISDKKLLRRIVQNLLSNAVRYTDSGGVLLGVRRTANNTIDICVVDTGPGIPKHQQADIFNEFHQLDNATQNQGLGLGLTIVERISHLLNHKVTLQSALGKGTCFRLNIARSKQNIAQKADIADDSTITTVPLLSSRKVLVLENDEQIIQAIVTLLEDWGAKVVVARNQSEALLVSPEPPDFMLVDYHLDHGETGINVVNVLRQHWRFPVPGILNTANRQEGVREEAQEAQLWYLPKPLKPAVLKRLLKKQKLTV
jgi:Na+/proline symporter/signal transduction histidine kinase